MNHYVNLCSDYRRQYDKNMSIKVQVPDLESQVDDGIIKFQVNDRYTVNCKVFDRRDNQLEKGKDLDGNPVTDVYEPGKTYYTDMSHFSVKPHFEVLDPDSVRKAKETVAVNTASEDEDEDDKYLDEKMLDAWDEADY